MVIVDWNIIGVLENDGTLGARNPLSDLLLERSDFDKLIVLTCGFGIIGSGGYDIRGSKGIPCS